MPFVVIRQAAGRTAEQKRKVIAGVTKAIADSYGVPEEQVMVMFFDLQPDDWGRGGRSHAETLQEAK